MRTSTKSRHNAVKTIFEKHYLATGSVDEATKLTAEETGYTVGYINQIRFEVTLKKEKKIA